ncbi:MAG TPA: amidase [Chitinophagaceae bacterium]|jgi:Asp-tRNA(Asn)/Glu-tRNA(Gln) amidotransferase A subunit family amidase|nr:amidase [Chitinophagaceae bacterium]
MRTLLIPAALLAASGLCAQSRTDSVQLLRQTASLYDLRFTEAEADSMVEDIRDYGASIRTLHQKLPSNALPYPFGFDPAPAGFTVPQGGEKINWILPKATLPKRKTDLAFYSVAQLAALIRDRQITSEALTRFFLDRLKKWDDSLHAVITLTEDLALQQARQADAELRAGRYRGPLHGIPYGLKDLFAVKGYKTTWGSTPYKDQVLEDNSFVYEQLTKAGAVLCAKLSLGALAFNDLWFGGRTNNPWNLRQGSSGSSAGSAAATAAGLLPFAIGTETWGSIVSPSTRCGVTGLRPTFGATSRSGAMVLSWSLDKAGPICRSAEDCAIVFAAMKGTDGKDPSARNYAFRYQPKALRTMRIAYAENYFRRLPKDAPEWGVLQVYRDLGATLTPVTFPDSALYANDIMSLVIGAESAAAFDELTRTDRDTLIERQDKGFWPNIFRGARLIPAAEYINANRHRYALIDTVNAFMKQWDVVIVPTYAGNQLALTNLTGHPVVVQPIGLHAGNNPLSITLIGNLYDEVSILQAAKAYQEKTGHHLMRPPLFDRD